MTGGPRNEGTDVALDLELPVDVAEYLLNLEMELDVSPN
jgi:hypothetical protein